MKFPFYRIQLVLLGLLVATATVLQIADCCRAGIKRSACMRLDDRQSEGFWLLFRHCFVACDIFHERLTYPRESTWINFSKVLGDLESVQPGHVVSGQPCKEIEEDLWRLSCDRTVCLDARRPRQTDRLSHHSIDSTISYLLFSQFIFVCHSTTYFCFCQENALFFPSSHSVFYLIIVDPGAGT